MQVVNKTQNLRWEGVKFQYATSLHASGDRGFVDTQSAYLYKDGEPGAWPCCRFAPPLVHSTPDPPTYAVPLFLKRQCDRTPGEPPVNIHVATSSNISFSTCDFSHLGGVCRGVSDCQPSSEGALKR